MDLNCSAKIGQSDLLNESKFQLNQKLLIKRISEQEDIKPNNTEKKRTQKFSFDLINFNHHC